MIVWKLYKKDQDFKKDYKKVFDVWAFKKSLSREIKSKKKAKVAFQDWIDKLDSEKEFKYPFLAGLFNVLGLPLIRRTFPTLFANKLVGVQAMTTPVGLAYALRVVYSDKEEKDEKMEL